MKQNFIEVIHHLLQLWILATSLRKTEDTYTAEATKQRDMEKGRFYFQLKQIDLGEKDEDGDPIV